MSSTIGSTWSTRHLGMFRGAPQLGNFSRLASILPARVVRRSSSPAPLRRAEHVAPLPSAYEFGGTLRDTSAFLADVETVGLVVIKDGAIVYDWYVTPTQPSLQWPSWSVAKSIVSCLVGIAIDEGAIESVHDPVTRYAPTLAGSAYDGVSIEHALQMCSGAQWSENYADPDSDVHRNALVMAGIGSRDELATATRRAFAPGTRHQYNSNDTQVLGMVLRGATGRGLTRLLQREALGTARHGRRRVFPGRFHRRGMGRGRRAGDAARFCEVPATATLTTKIDVQRRCAEYRETAPRRNADPSAIRARVRR